MDKINLSFNELLRFFFAGAWGIAWFLLLTIGAKSDSILINIHTEIELLIFLALIVGIFTYSIHRAIIYPIVYKFALVVLVLLRKIKWDWRLLIPFYPSPTEMYHDFRRWKERLKKKSLSGNLVEWGSQIHLLYCSTWTIWLAIGIATSHQNCVPEFLGVGYWVLRIMLFGSFIHHVRYLIYDIDTEKNEGA